ncbi:MAG TPA: glycosyltransferase [Panacibacter sp.]|nr:glycosyltransferase [Panacibacter sp.]
MSVLIAVRNISGGGAEILECRLAVALNNKGILTDLLSQYSLNDFDKESDVLEWEKAGVPKVQWLNAKGATGIFFSVFRLIKIIRLNKYDYVITANSGLDSIAAIARFFCSFKHIVALHDYPHSTVTKSLRFKLWCYLIARSAHKLYAVSTFVKKGNLKFIKVEPEKISVIYNSINVPFLTAHSKSFLTDDFTNLETGTKKILLTGRLIRRKGIDIVLKIFSGLLSSFNAQLFIAGDSFDKGIEEGVVGYKEELIKLIDRLNLNDRVKILGRRNDVFNLMQQSDILIHLPRHEGFGLVLIEAIAAGIPVVASNVGGIPEVMSRTPYKVFDLENTEGITEQVKQFLLMDDDMKKMIITSAKECLGYYSDDRRSDEIIEKIFS